MESSRIDRFLVLYVNVLYIRDTLPPDSSPDRRSK